MDYPRELKLSPEREEALKQYLDTELMTHRAERAKWVLDLQRWQEDYWATPAAEEATFPFKGASNVIIPLTAIAVESIHARDMMTLFALNQLTSVKIIDPSIPDDAMYDLEKAIDWELLNGCDFRKFADSTGLENKKLGSCIGKSGYEKIVKTAVRDNAGIETEFEVITKQGPTCTPVPLANFLMPFTATDPQLSPWVGEEHLTNLYDFKQMVNSGYLGQKDVMDKLTMYYSQQQNLSSTPYTQSVRNVQDQLPIQWPREIGWNEIWLAFDVDSGPGFDVAGQPIEVTSKTKEIVVHYHWPSRTILSVRYNWYSDLHRPYRIGNYIPMENRWAGIGIGKQNEQFQEAVTATERQRMDNATLANMRMFKAKQGSGIGPNEPLFPGKIFMVEDPDDIMAIEGGSEVYPSGYNDSQQLIIFSQQRTKVNELTLGMPQVGTPGTATGDLTRVQESKHGFDYTFSNYKEFCRSIVVDMLCNQSQFGFRDRRYFGTLGTNGPVVENLLKMDPNDIRSQLFYEVYIVGQSRSDLVDLNNWTQFAQMLTGYWTQMIQLAMQTGNKQIIGALMAQAMKSGTDAMKQIAEGYQIKNADRLLIPKELIAQIGGGLISGPPQLQPGGSPNQTPSGSNEGEGMGNSLKIA